MVLVLVLDSPANRSSMSTGYALAVRQIAILKKCVYAPFVPLKAALLEAWKADKSYAGVEGPGDRLRLRSQGLKGRHTNLALPLYHETPFVCQPFGLFELFLDMQPVVNTTGRGYASPSGLRLME